MHCQCVDSLRTIGIRMKKGQVSLMSVKKWVALIIGTALVFSLAACCVGQNTEPTIADASAEEVTEGELHFKIGNTEVSVDWESNNSVKALIKLVELEPLEIEMSMYGGFEQVGSLGTSLPRDDKQITTKAGDIVLYSGNQIVVFYGSNSWAYTRLGSITDKTASEMADLLGNGNVRITISSSL